jgi:hypothetical protein
VDAEVRTERQADAGKSLAAVILGNDAVAAIRPYASSQLARACVAAGFDVIVPPSWGDELVAGAYLEQLADRLEYAVAPCACPLVRSMLDRSGGGTAVGCAFAAAPPVAAARYVRAQYGESVLITYVGDCPSASDHAIDARFSPGGFLASLNRQGITIEDQPVETIAAEADRWRRYRSTPGGVPALRYLARAPINRVLRDGDADSLTQGLPEARSNMVVDFSIAAHCVCRGAGASVDDDEPPRSQTPIVVAPNGLDLSPAASPPRVRPTLRARPETGPEPRTDATGAVPSDGSALAPATPSVPPVARLEAQRNHGVEALREVTPRTSARERIAVLALVPVVVLAVAAALGVTVYRASQPEAPSSRSARVAPSIATDSTALRTPDSSMGFAPNQARDSAKARQDSAADSTVRRRRAVQVVPGWLPQGRPKFTPVDSFAARKP